MVLFAAYSSMAVLKCRHNTSKVPDIKGRRKLSQRQWSEKQDRRTETVTNKGMNEKKGGPQKLQKQYDFEKRRKLREIVSERFQL